MGLAWGSGSASGSSALPALFVLAAGAAASPIFALASTTYGTFYEIGTRKPIFRMKFEELSGGKGPRHVQAEYRTPAGKLVMTEEALYAPDGALQEYSLKQLQSDETARVVFNDGKVSFLMRQGRTESAASEDLTPQTMINDQMETIVARHWDEISAGRAVPIRIVVPLRKETIAFELAKEKESRWKEPAKKTLVVAMRPQSFLVRVFLKPILLTFDAEAQRHRLLGVQGRTALKSEGDPRGPDIDAALEFDP